MAHIEDGVEVIQVPGIDGLTPRERDRLLREKLGIRANVRNEYPGFAAEPFDGGQGVRDRIVLVTATHIPNGEQLLLGRLRGQRKQ